MTEPGKDGTRGATRGRVATASPASRVKWNERLFGPALDFAASEERLIRALAGPGTGKTFALIRRVARLLESGVDPDRILVLTFARTAATDLVVALRKLGEAGYREVKAQTLHSYCFSLLWRQGRLLATARTPRIVMDFEREYGLVDLEGPFGGLRDRRAMAIAFQSAWAYRLEWAWSQLVAFRQPSRRSGAPEAMPVAASASGSAPRASPHRAGPARRRAHGRRPRL